MKKKCVIIGSGLGGLSCGVILAKNNYDVTLLEQEAQLGGCMQCFYRNGAKFETGMHFIGSADKGQTLSQLLHYLEVDKDIRLNRLDPLGYDVISLGGEQFKLANGKRPFIEQMAKYFPKEKDNLIRYYDLVEQIANASSLHSLGQKFNLAINTEYQTRSINNVLEQLIKDPMLRNVLLGNLPLYAAQQDKTPFSSHAFIMDFYNQSAFRIIGGSENIGLSLTNTIRRKNGTVLTNKQVVHIDCDDIRAKGVTTADGTFYPADIIISDTHPMRTLEMLDTNIIRSIYRKRVNNIPNTISCFAVYLKFKSNTVPYMNSNFYCYKNDSPWDCENYDEFSWPKGYLYMHFCHKQEPIFAENGIILSYMSMEEVKKWENTLVGHRGKDYELFKQQKAQRLLNEVERSFPVLKNNVEHYYTSTPLTYRDYTGTQDGSMYGVIKDVSMGAAYRVSHKTKIPNLLLTGQNTNSHGALGVLISTIVTCSELLSAERIYKQVMESNK